MFSKLFSLLAAFLLISTVSGGVIRDRRAIEDYWYQNNGVVNNVVQDGVFGGPTSLGWAQVPHRLSPMFSPVFGGR